MTAAARLPILENDAIDSYSIFGKKGQHMTNREETRTQIKGMLRDYVEMITESDPKAGRNMYKCPLCGSGSHGGKNSDGAFSITPDGERWKCFSCNKSGDILDLIGYNEGITEYNEQLQRAADLLSVCAAYRNTRKAAEHPQLKKKPQPGQFRDYIKKCAAAANETDYYISRGLTAETVERFSLGYDRSKAAIVIPYDRSGSYYITRSTTAHEFHKPLKDLAGDEPVYNNAALYSGQPCFICESPLDAISIMQAGGYAAAIGGTGSDKLIDAIKIKPPTNTLILCFDNDAAGEDATQTTAEKLKKININFIVADFNLDQYHGNKKDANDLLQANSEQLKQDIRQNIKKAWRKAAFIPYKVSDYLKCGTYEADIDYFKRYRNRKTGFSNIDQHLTLYPGLAALGGSASLGKSTFAVNLADNLILRGETVLYFALEQEPIELVTKSLARRLYAKDPLTPITNIDIKNGASSEALEAVKEEYAAVAGRFVIVRCNFTTTAEDIREYVEEFIYTTGNRPVVFIDYLQLISPPADFRGDIRTATDHIVKTFKTMQTDNELLVIMISNFNRNSYVVPVSYEAFKETSMIEFTCDYVWGLQLSILEDSDFYTTENSRGGEKETSVKAKKDAIYNANRQNPKEVEFVSLKSRNGKQSYKCFFKYNMPFDTFTEDLNSPHDKESNFAGFTPVTTANDNENPFNNDSIGIPIN